MNSAPYPELLVCDGLIKGVCTDVEKPLVGTVVLSCDELVNTTPRDVLVFIMFAVSVCVSSRMIVDVTPGVRLETCTTLISVLKVLSTELTLPLAVVLIKPRTFVDTATGKDLELVDTGSGKVLEDNGSPSVLCSFPGSP